MHDDLWLTIATIAALVAGSAGCAALLRRAGAPGWAVLGGVAAGLLLGPTVFGRLSPQMYERSLIGGIHERQTLDAIVQRHGAELAAARHAQLDAEAIQTIRQRHLHELETPAQQLLTSRWRHQTPWRWFTLAVVAATSLSSAAMAIRRRDERQSLIGAINVGAWAAALPGSAAFLAAMWFWDMTVMEAALVAAAVAVGPLALTPSDQQAADDAEHGGAWMMQTAGRAASVIALIAALTAAASLDSSERRWVLCGLLTVPIGWMVTAAVRSDRVCTGLNRLARRLNDSVLVPTLAGCVAVKLDVLQAFALWPAVLLILLSGDGRWLGAFIGAMLHGGRRGLRTMRLVLGSMATGPAQLTITALALHAWAIPSWAGLALLAGALATELFTPARRFVAAEIVRTEHDLTGRFDDHR